MSLINDGTRTYDWQGNIMVPSVVLFAQAERRLKSKKELLEDMKNEYDLLEKQAFDLYRSHVNYFFMDPNTIKKAAEWFSMKKLGKDANGNKLDGRKHYEEKDTAEFLFDKIQEYLGIDDMKVDRIVEFNFGEAEEIIFTSHSHKWYLQVPIIRGVKIDSYRRYGANCFQLSLHHFDTEHCTAMFGSTFEEEKLKDIMAAGIEKYCKEDK